MEKSRFTYSQILAVLKQAQSGWRPRMRVVRPAAFTSNRMKCLGKGGAPIRGSVPPEQTLVDRRRR